MIMQPSTPYGNEPLTSKMIGQSIRLEKRLGVGSSGEVWLASAIVDARHLPPFLKGVPEAELTSFAVKVIRAEHLRSARHQQLVQQEIQSLKQLKHPYINRYIASWVERSEDASLDGCMCIATQYCSGGDLRSLIQKRADRRQPFSTDAVMYVAAQLLSACAYVHSQKLLHRDVKPGNIFVKSGGDGITLGDFGLSRELASTIDCADSRVGTANYCSPQVVMGEPYTAKTDVWSVGVVLYEMMTFQRPFFSVTNAEEKVFQRIVYDDPIPALKELSAGRYTNTLINLVDAALNKSETERPSALQLLTTFSGTFSQFVKERGIPIPTPRVSSPLRVPPSKPERVASPLRGGAPVAAKHTSPLRPRIPKATTAATSPLPKHVDPQRTEPSAQQQLSDIVSSLLQSNASQQASGRSAGTTVTVPSAANISEILKALHDDEELFLLTKVLLLTRQGKDRAFLEDGLFKLLLAMRPEVNALRAIELLLPAASASAKGG